MIGFTNLYHFVYVRTQNNDLSLFREKEVSGGPGNGKSVHTW